MSLTFPLERYTLLTHLRHFPLETPLVVHIPTRKTHIAHALETLPTRVARRLDSHSKDAHCARFPLETPRRITSLSSRPSLTRLRRPLSRLRGSSPLVPLEALALPLKRLVPLENLFPLTGLAIPPRRPFHTSVFGFRAFGLADFKLCSQSSRAFEFRAHLLH